MKPPIDRTRPVTITQDRLAPRLIAPAPTEVPWTLDALGPPALSFCVLGTPAPQGSKKSVGTRKGKKGQDVTILAESSKKVAPWRREVAKAARAALTAQNWPGPLDYALVLDMVFTMPRPASFPARDTRRQHGLPTVYPDVSKLARSTEDGMTKIVWADDARIVGYRRLDKTYVGGGDPDGLRKPGAVIRVWTVPESVVAARAGGLL